ncbi:RNA polymerase sigma factor [Occallatibacter savannae]|uniref:RNA polymerase sigma factor n=1 Tax=Occallatibacter savannae TaxID=1002691 RepID=UPI000D699F40|nr:RNA polymerase sigma factor [Occallatibacter savannae]
MRDDASSVLSKFRHGDIDAFETLFRTHQRSVQGWVLRIVRDLSAAEDVTIEAFWRMHQAHARFDPERGFEPWARRIATHAAIDWLRRQKPESGLCPEQWDIVPARPASDPAITSELRAKTVQAFARLPAKLRVAALLGVVEEQPHKEVAEALGISVGAVKLRIFRALRLLRKDLTQQGITP